MPHVTPELVAQAYEALASGDMAEIEKYWDRDMNWLVPGHNRLSGWYHGRDGFLAFMGEVGRLSGSTFHMARVAVMVSDEYSADVTFNEGDRAGYEGKGTVPYTKLSIDVVHVLRWRDGKIIEGRGAIFGNGTNEYDQFWSPFGPEGERLGETAQERNKALVRLAIEEGWNGGDLDVIEELYAPQFVFHQEGGGAIEGVEAFKQWVQVIHTAFPDIHYTINAMYAEGDKVATRYTATGTHTGDFRGIPPTGKSFNLTGHMIHRIRDGQKIEGWGVWDTVGLLISLGILPPLALGGPPPQQEPSRDGTWDVEANKAAVRRLLLAMGDPDSNTIVRAIDDLMVPDFVTHGTAMFPYVRGTDILKQAIPGFKAAFPDVEVEILQLFAEQDRVMSHIRLTGTHKGELMGMPATNKRISWTGTQIVRFNEEGKMVERWVLEDEMRYLQAIGKIPYVEGQAFEMP
jgi:steroid delta-isomerase-like uncharacterized protein